MNTPSQPQDPANSLPDPNAAPQQPSQQPDPNTAPSQPQSVNTANQPSTGAEKQIATKFNGDVYAWFLKELCHVADLSEVGEYELMCGADGDDDVTDARFKRVYKIHSREYQAKTGVDLPSPNNTPVASIFDAYVKAHPVPPPQPVVQAAPQSVPQPASQATPAQPDPGTQQMPASAAPVQAPATIPQAPAAPVSSVTPEQAFQNFLRHFTAACNPERFNRFSEQDLRDLCAEYQKTNAQDVRDVAHFVELKGLNLPASAAPVQDPATIPQAPADPGQAPADPAQAPADPGQAPAQNPNPAQPAGPVSPEEKAYRDFLVDFIIACDPERYSGYTEQDLRALCSEFQGKNSVLVRDVAHFVELKGLNLPPADQSAQEKRKLYALRAVLGISVIALAGTIYAARKEIYNFVHPTGHKPVPTATAPKPSAAPAPQPSAVPSPKPVATTEPTVVPVAPPPSAIPTETAEPAPTPAPEPTATASAAPTASAIASAEPAPQPSATAPVQPGRIPLKAFTVLCTNRSIPENCKPADPAVIPYINTCKFDGIQYLTRPLTIPCTDAQGYPGPVYTTKYRIQDRAAYSGTPYGENVEFTVYLNE